MQVSAIILAGGLAKRMGGVDKGLVTLQQKPLIQHVINRLQPQVDELLINANRELLHYKNLGYPIFEDEQTDFIGPLAGFNLGLKYGKHDYLLTAPCDSPLLPMDLAQRLMRGLTEQQADIAVATCADKTHPVFSLCKKSVLPSLTDYLENGGRKVSMWQKSLKYIEVDFSDCSDAFINLNTLEEIIALEKTTLGSKI